MAPQLRSHHCSSSGPEFSSHHPHLRFTTSGTPAQGALTPLASVNTCTHVLTPTHVHRINKSKLESLDDAMKMFVLGIFIPLIAMRMGVLSACAFVYCVHGVPWAARRRHWITWDCGDELPCGCWDLNLGLPEEQ